MAQQIIIGFAGKAGAGKSEATAALWALGFKSIAFADPLKRAAAELFGFSHAQMFTADGKATADAFWGFTPREAMQKLGTEAMRGVFGEDFWLRRFRLECGDTQRVAVCDVRFPNEAQAVRDAGGRVVLISRPGAGLEGAAAAHPSETALDGWPFDMEIENDGTVAQLHACVKETALEFFPELRR